MYIKDASGNIVYLRGVDKTDFLTDSTGNFGSIGVWSQATMQADVNKMKSHGFNIIRVLVNMNWMLTNSRQNWNGQGNRGFVDCLKDYVAYAETQGIYILLVPWQILGASGPGGSGQSGGETDPWGISPISTIADFVNWWGTVATTFAPYSNMLYDLWNEYHGDYDTWLGSGATSAVAQATTRIRTITQSPVIVQNGYAGGIDWVPGEWSWLGPLRNIVISQHIYRVSTFSGFQSSTSKTQIANVLNNTWGYDSVVGHYPLIIGELGAYIGGAWGDNAAEQTWHQNLLSLLNDWGVSYAEWIWDMQYNGAYAVQVSPRGSLTWAGQNLVNAIAAG
jgi:hypothetical protein